MEKNTNNRSLRIGFLTPEYPHEYCGRSAGLGSSIKNLAHSLVKEGIAVHVFIYGQKETCIIEEEGIELHFIQQKKYSCLSWYFNRKYIQNYLNKQIVAYQIDLIEAPDWTGITAFMKLKAKLVIRLHGSDAYFCHLEGRNQKNKNYWLEKRALTKANAIIGVSDFVAQKTKEIFKLKRQIVTIYNGIDTEMFIPLLKNEEEGLLLYFGTIIRKKGVLELAQAFNKLVEINAKAKLILLGKDSQDVFENKSTLEIFMSSLAPESRAKVSHIKEVPYKEVKEYLQKASVVVLPSFAEAFPMTWLEAMAMEKALVTSNIGWAKEVMVHQKTGYTINPKDHVDFAQKMNALLLDTQKRNEYGKAARNQILNYFSLDVTVSKNVAYYNNLINNS